jgi:hypothetical protein
MGCFDIFCFICGNPCHKMLINIREIIDSYNDKKIKKSKWFKNYAKPIVEFYNKEPNFYKKIDDFKVKTNWMDNCSILLNDNRIIHNCKEKSCNVDFVCNKNSYMHDPNYFIDPEIINKGIFIHTDCWKWCYDKYNIKLSYNILPILRKSNNYYKTFDFINYGEIEKYWEQDFDFLTIFTQGKEYLCSTPLHNDKNIKQIIKNFKKLKIRDKNRKSPSVSASFYDNNIYKIGNDNNIWICKNKKWIKTNEKTIRINVNKIPEQIDFIGGFSKIPIFIEKIQKNQYTLILLESQKDILN